jgi:hypothetical protein
MLSSKNKELMQMLLKIDRSASNKLIVLSRHHGSYLLVKKYTYGSDCMDVRLLKPALFGLH